MNNKLKKFLALTLCMVIVFSLSACGSDDSDYAYDGLESVEMDVSEEVVILQTATANISSDLIPQASGKDVKEGSDGKIDYSNIADGYVMVKYGVETDKTIKAQVKGPTTTYTYNVTPKKWESFPLSDGNGSYTIALYKQVSGTSYSAVTSVSFTVKLNDEFAPFLKSSQYVNFANAPNACAKAKTLVKGKKKDLAKVKAVYDYVINNTTYDTNKAKTVQSGYLPKLDSTLKTKKGICFDYAALMTGMLRSQGIPCKLVIGYAGNAYHAWISVYTKEEGWVDDVIHFTGKKWQRMDPTFASSGKSSKAILKYIGDGSNYTAKYFY